MADIAPPPEHRAVIAVVVGYRQGYTLLRTPPHLESSLPITIPIDHPQFARLPFIPPTEVLVTYHAPRTLQHPIHGLLPCIASAVHYLSFHLMRAKTTLQNY